MSLFCTSGLSNSSGYADHMDEILTQKFAACRNPVSKQVNEHSNKPTNSLWKKPLEAVGVILEQKFTVYWLF